MRRHMLEILIFGSPLNFFFDLNVFTINELINDISHENIIQEPPIDLTFENLFEEELMYLDESIKDILVDVGIRSDTSIKD